MFTMSTTNLKIKTLTTAINSRYIDTIIKQGIYFSLQSQGFYVAVISGSHAVLILHFYCSRLTGLRQQKNKLFHSAIKSGLFMEV